MEHATTTTAADPAPELPKFSFLYELHQEGSHWLCAGRRADEERPKVFISPSYPPLLRKELVEAFGRFAQESECLEGAVPVLCLYDFSGQPGGGNDEDVDDHNEDRAREWATLDNPREDFIEGDLFAVTECDARVALVKGFEVVGEA